MPLASRFVLLSDAALALVFVGFRPGFWSDAGVNGDGKQGVRGRRQGVVGLNMLPRDAAMC